MTEEEQDTGKKLWNKFLSGAAEEGGKWFVRIIGVIVIAVFLFFGGKWAIGQTMPKIETPKISAPCDSWDCGSGNAIKNAWPFGKEKDSDEEPDNVERELVCEDDKWWHPFDCDEEAVAEDKDSPTSPEESDVEDRTNTVSEETSGTDELEKSAEVEAECESRFWGDCSVIQRFRKDKSDESNDTSEEEAH